MRDDDCSLELGKQHEEPTHFNSLQDRLGRVLRGQFGHRVLAE